MKKLHLITQLLIFFSFISNAQIEDPQIEKNENVNRSKIVVYTKTGEVYKGYFISQNKDFLELDTEAAGRVRIPTERIKKVESLSQEKSISDDEDETLDQINPVRYMLGTSAFNYEKGKNYIRNNPMTFHRGVSDNFSVGVGTSIWALILRVPILYVNPHFTADLSKNLHYKLGLDAFAGTSLEEGMGGAGAIANTGLTLGEPDLNITATVYLGALSEIGRLDPFYSLAGMARISKEFVLLSEGFYIPSELDGATGLWFYGGRYLTQRASYDFGFLYNEEIAEFLPIGVPFIAITLQL